MRGPPNKDQRRLSRWSQVALGSWHCSDQDIRAPAGAHVVGGGGMIVRVAGAEDPQPVRHGRQRYVVLHPEREVEG